MGGTVSREDIDKMVTLPLGHSMGLLTLADVIGLDQLLNEIEYLHRELGKDVRPSPMFKKPAAVGYCGRKTGRGVYNYSY